MKSKAALLWFLLFSTGVLASSCDKTDDDASRDGSISTEAGVGTTVQALVAPTMTTLSAVGDTDLVQFTPTLNSGTTSSLRVTGASLTNWQAGLVKFDAVAIRSAVGTGTLQSATLELTVSSVSLGWGNSQVSVSRMTMPWTELGATWLCGNDTDHSLLGRFVNNCATQDRWGLEWWSLLPRPFSGTPTATISVPLGQQGVVNADVTADIQTVLTGDAHHGWILSSTADLSTVWVQFSSREGTAAPRLVLSVLPSCTVLGPDTTCDATDDDCDSRFDEAYVSTASSCGVGACARTGTTSCVSGAISDSCSPGIPGSSDTTCDGVDNNCNGAVDEGYVSQSSACGVGACLRMGAISCVNGSLENGCVPGTPAASDVTCDGVDDDCNGAADDGYVAPSILCGVGACQASGSRRCEGGVVIDQCTPLSPAEQDNTCNGQDENCNGQIDEQYVSQSTTCEVGGCRKSGTLQCLAGQPVDTCFESPTCIAEVNCSDASDNDGDGAADCNDEDCWSAPGCIGTVERCGNGLDDDIDGAPDCSDPDCLIHASCTALPRDPRDVVTMPTTGDLPDFAELVSFLYTGSDPIQQGVLPGTILPDRVATVRGQTLDREGMPLSGVVITVLDHPELGQTRSRQDGNFDLALNGGAPRTLVYQLAGYLPVQRSIKPDWGDRAVVDAVVLIPLDSLATPIDLANGTGMQVAVSSSSTDTEGTRKVVMLFSDTVEAQAVMPDLSVHPLTQLTVRATEFTVGSSGPLAMPAELPKTTNYTYAVELSVDEALAQGARSVQFSEAVPVYVENFLGFPVGTAVPVGFYDRALGRWSAQPNGRVVKVVAITAGLADLDLTGDDVADDGVAFGISSAERTRLASIYSPGQTLWRVALQHFSPYDLNWQIDLTGAEAPVAYESAYDLGGAPPQAPVNDPCAKPGSILHPENGDVIEHVPVAATPFSLVYTRSRAALGTVTPFYRIQLRVHSGPYLRVPVGVYATLRIGGRIYEKTLSVTDEVAEFVIDGDDVYGLPLSGGVRYETRVCFEYAPTYGPVPPEYEAAFASYRAALQWALLRGATTLEAEGAARRTFFICSEGRGIESFWRRPAQATSSIPPSNFGEHAWTVDVHHTYDPTSRTLHLGDGTARLASGHGVSTQFTDVFTGTNGTNGFVWLDDGSLLYMEYAELNGTLFGIQPVRRLPNGAKEVADTSSYWSSVGADGWAAIPRTLGRVGDEIYVYDAIWQSGERWGRLTAFKLDSNNQFIQPGRTIVNERGFTIGTTNALGSDGSVYYQTGTNLKRVSADGRIMNEFDLPGHNAQGRNTNAVQLTSASSYAPGTLRAGFSPIAVGEDETVYVAATWDHATFGDFSALDAIYAYRTDGSVEKLASSQAYYEAGFGEIFAMTVEPGTRRLFLIAERTPSDTFVDPVLVVFDSGEFAYVAGRALRPDYSPTDAFTMRASDVLQFGPDGQLYFAQRGNFQDAYKIRRAEPSLPGKKLQAEVYINVPSEDGALVYRFTTRGRHVDTRDALSGAVRYSFEYDAKGVLTGVRDGSGNLTRFVRNPDGTLDRVVAPFGQVTDVDHNALGLISRVTVPDGNSYEFTYVDEPRFSKSALLATARDSRGLISTFGYDDFGALQSDVDSTGGSLTMQREHLASGVRTTATSAQGRATHYDVSRVSGELTRVVTQPDATVNKSVESANGIRTTTFADGTKVTQTQIADPRWGATAPFESSRQVRLPSGLTRTTTTTRTAVLTSPVDPLTLERMTDTISVNGRITTRDFHVSTATLTLTSPEGRTSRVFLDGNGRVQSVQRPGLAAIAYVYDNFGRKASTTYGSGDEARVFGYSYHTGDPSSQGQLATIQLPLAGQTLSFLPDVWGRALEFSGADGATTLNTFEPGGRPFSIEPPGRDAHTFTYTLRGDRDKYTAPSAVAGDPNPILDFDYSLDRNLELAKRPDGRDVDPVYNPTTGQLQQLSFPGVTLNYGYRPVTGTLENLSRIDGVGTNTVWLTRDGARLSRVEWTGSSGMTTGAVVREHDTNFWLSREIVNNFFPLVYGYDNDGLLTSADIETIVRNPTTGLPESTTIDQTNSTLTWNGHGEIASQTVNSNATTLFSETIDQRDAMGRIRASTVSSGSLPTVAREYNYDSAQRLESVVDQGVPIAQYTYDPNGNRLSRTSALGTVRGTYDGQDRLTLYCPQDAASNPTPVPGLPCARYTYRASGELATKVDLPSNAVTQYEYDALGALTQVTLPDGKIVSYEIDARGRRVGKRINGVKSWGMLYRDAVRPIFQVGPDNQLRAVFVYGVRANVPDLLINVTGYYRIISDHLGSVRLVVDVSTGAIAQQLEYDEFGRVVLDTNPGFQPFGFAGGLYDPDTGLTRFGARDYDAVAGRWTAKDPIYFRGGDSNLYAYAFNDPVNLVDPTGHLGFIATGLVGGAFGAGFGALNAMMNDQSVLAGAAGGFAAGFVAGTGAALAAAIFAGSGAVGAALGTYTAGGYAAVGNVLGQYVQYEADPSTGNPASRLCGGEFNVDVGQAIVAGLAGGLGYGVAGPLGSYASQIGPPAEIAAESVANFLGQTAETAVNSFLGAE